MLRHLSRGPVGTEDDLGDDAWAEVRHWTDGHNQVRKAKLRAGSKVTPDEDMLWLGWAQMTAAVRSL